ncbi:hypothetical protein J6590_070993 [Homalodisca vitripennis]|nr:hypothetical protein J6590_070993 [Homalodisca vitripennis]
MVTVTGHRSPATEWSRTTTRCLTGHRSSRPWRFGLSVASPCRGGVCFYDSPQWCLGQLLQSSGDPVVSGIGSLLQSSCCRALVTQWCLGSGLLLQSSCCRALVTQWCLGSGCYCSPAAAELCGFLGRVVIAVQLLQSSGDPVVSGVGLLLQSSCCRALVIQCSWTQGEREAGRVLRQFRLTAAIPVI